MAQIDIHTDDKLLKKLNASVKRGITSEEIEKQRISFIYSGMPEKSKLSKLEIEKALKTA